MADKKTRISDYLDYSLTLDMVNDYRNSIGEDEVYDMEYFNDNMESDYTYSEVIDMVKYGDFETYHDYYRCDGSSLESYSSLDGVVDVSEIVDYILDNEDALGDSFIQEILDEKDNERTLIIHNGDEAQELTKSQFEDKYRDTGYRFYNREHNTLWTDTGVLSLYDEEDEDMGEDKELWVFNIGHILADNGKTGWLATIMGKTGWVIPTEEMTAFYAKFYWFYIPEGGQLMKLIYDSYTLDENNVDSPKYIEYDPRLGRDVEALEKALEC